jgi:hypothetical protein
LSGRQVRLVIDADGIFPVTDERRTEYADLQRRVEGLARSDRCRIDEVKDGSDVRYLVHDFRRTSGAAPKKILL